MGLCKKILDDTSGLMDHRLVMLLDFCQNIENEESHKVQKQEGHQENVVALILQQEVTSDDNTPYFSH